MGTQWVLVHQMVRTGLAHVGLHGLCCVCPHYLASAPVLGSPRALVGRQAGQLRGQTHQASRLAAPGLWVGRRAGAEGQAVLSSPGCSVSGLHPGQLIMLSTPARHLPRAEPLSNLLRGHQV